MMSAAQRRRLLSAAMVVVAADARKARRATRARVLLGQRVNKRIHALRSLARLRPGPRAVVGRKRQ